MSKKQILICLYAYYPYENANTNVMLPLINELSTKYEVHILTKNNDNKAKEYEEYDENIIVHRYKRNSLLKNIVNTLANIETKKKRIWYKTIIIKLLNPIAKVLQRYIKNNEFIELKKLMKNNKFEFVITTCESFESHRNMLYFKKETKDSTPWFAYFMDPYSTYIENSKAKGDLLKTEMEVYSMADLVLVTEEIYKENHTNSFSQYLYKTHPFKFGNFKCINHQLINNIFIPNKINCVYIGSLLSKKIRDPEYLYNLINILDDNYHFHIICNKASNENKQQFEAIVKDKSKVTWYNNLPLNECLGIMCNADILINLGNKSVNQTPSKVFDYIGTGKPIVNFYSIENDTSKYYLEKYQNKLNIYEDYDCIDKRVDEFKKFTKNNKAVIISSETLEKDYSEYDSKKVTYNTIKIINEFMEQKEEEKNVKK